jgi:hypothetical protein
MLSAPELGTIGLPCVLAGAAPAIDSAPVAGVMFAWFWDDETVGAKPTIDSADVKGTRCEFPGLNVVRISEPVFGVIVVFDTLDTVGAKPWIASAPVMAMILKDRDRFSAPVFGVIVVLAMG